MSRSPEPRPPTEFATMLKAYRVRHGLTQAQAARVLEVSRRTLENWEASRNAPKGFALTVLRRTLKG